MVKRKEKLSEGKKYNSKFTGARFRFTTFSLIVEVVEYLPPTEGKPSKYMA